MGLFLFYIPQVITIHKSKVLQGFFLPAWIALWVAVVSLVVQSLIIGIWTAAAANIIGVGAIAYVIVQVIRKGGTSASN